MEGMIMFERNLRHTEKPRGQFEGDLKKCTGRIKLCHNELERLERELADLNRIYAGYNMPVRKKSSRKRESKK